MRPLSKELLEYLDGDGLSEEVTYDTDHGPFMLEGVPALDFGSTWHPTRPFITNRATRLIKWIATTSL